MRSMVLSTNQGLPLDLSYEMLPLEVPTFVLRFRTNRSFAPRSVVAVFVSQFSPGGSVFVPLVNFESRFKGQGVVSLT